MSELSVSLPSGIALYEDDVSYPAQSPASRQPAHMSDPTVEVRSPASSFTERNEELVAFQISTNAAIRRLINRIHSIFYDTEERNRVSDCDHVQWLLRITGDFSAYHDAIFRNLPEFLLVSEPEKGQTTSTSPATLGLPILQGRGNNPWNVLRLKGRYHACRHIIYRPFVEYALLNRERIQSHPEKERIFERCRLCLQGCTGFIKVFDVDMVNSITCLFATGMA